MREWDSGRRRVGLVECERVKDLAIVMRCLRCRTVETHYVSVKRVVLGSGEVRTCSCFAEAVLIH